VIAITDSRISRETGIQREADARLMLGGETAYARQALTRTGCTRSFKRGEIESRK
jgi:hypothetical protein